MLTAVILASSLLATPQLVSARDTLGGIAGFKISFYGLDQEATAAGLTETALRTQVEAALRRCGVPVLQDLKDAKDPGTAAILELVVWITGKDPHGAIVVKPNQLARISSGDLTWATTWEYWEILSPRSGPSDPQWINRIDKALIALCEAYTAARQKWLASRPSGGTVGKSSPVLRKGDSYKSVMDQLNFASDKRQFGDFLDATFKEPLLLAYPDSGGTCTLTFMKGALWKCTGCSPAIFHCE